MTDPRTPAVAASLAAAPSGGTMATSRDEAKRIVWHGTEAERAALAGLPGTAPELLYFMARDAAFAVRAAIAANAATPPQADSLLATDEDPRIRAILGRKLAGLAPMLGPDARDRLRRLTWDTLCRLAADAAELVRRMIAEEVKAMPDAPRELVLRLARDASMAVAEPVIRFSPLLTEDDLLALVMGPPVPETVVAVARRPGISETVSDAIAAAENPQAVAALLGNASAMIREATLDALIAGAGTNISWQAPLVARPHLPKRAAQALASCVADHLLGALAARPDLDPALATSLRGRVRQRLADDAGDTRPAEAAGNGEAPAARPAPDLSPEEAFAAAARQGDRTALAGLIGRRAQVPEAVVLRAAQMRSAKGLVSLCWRARLSPRCAFQAQTLLAGIAPALALGPNADGGWPLREREMAWQIEMLMEATATAA